MLCKFYIVISACICILYQFLGLLSVVNYGCNQLVLRFIYKVFVNLMMYVTV